MFLRNVLIATSFAWLHTLSLASATDEKAKALGAEALDISAACELPPSTPDDELLRKRYQACLDAYLKFMDARDEATSQTYKSASESAILLMSPSFGSIALELAIRSLKAGDEKKGGDYLRVACGQFGIALPVSYRGETAKDAAHRRKIEKLMAITDDVARRGFRKNCRTFKTWYDARP